MMFARRLRDGVRSGAITTSIRIWQSPRVKTGGIYRMDPGHIVIDSVREIARDDITDAMARASGFADVADLLEVARHGRGTNVYLIGFRYVAPDA